ncbi:hypothetical protein [Gracilimonas mengyeensis]|uniref:Uncharacterized protein n=1 Tax=Gracilimonas mengyeensis TaxID=1302730 RepID=A0A521APB0_9BACT|nr:hypothetical protein [Gracilimonas mengyeensis]SMO36679.1 hypothetical protein SAMN06265219_101295 [Gracilimonas mengyeensis]
MDLQTEKDFIKAELDKVDDIHLVKAIKHILASGTAKNYEHSKNPMSKETFYKRNEISRQGIEEDALISQEEAKQYFVRKNDQ